MDKLYMARCVIESFEGLVNPLTEQQEEDHRKTGAFKYIPFDPFEFLNQLEMALIASRILAHEAKPKFIDVGCGIGTKVLLAENAGCEGYGIEINPEYVKVAKKLVSSKGMGLGFYQKHEGRAKRIIEGNAIKHNYKPYDIIYFYGPPCDQKLAQELEARVALTARPGAIIIANYIRSDRWYRSGKNRFPVTPLNGDNGRIYLKEKPR